MYNNLESEQNPDHEVGNDSFEPNSFIMEILAHESNDKHTIARLTYLREKEGEMGKEVKITTGRNTRITT